MDHTPESPRRRRFLSGIVTGILAAISGVLGTIVGGAAFSPKTAGREERWLPASDVEGLRENEPMPVTLRVVRQDGYRQVVDRRIIFLVKTGDAKITALDSTCTHLGCRVAWDPDAQQLKCPCHGGVYDRNGAVVSGPPPSPLASIATRIEDGRVLVQV